jgi:hypothetical protein
MSRFKQIFHACAAGGFIAAAAGFSGSALAAPSSITAQTQTGTLTALNGSGANGTISIQLRGERYLTVQVDATGLEPGIQHLGHIHGRQAPGNVVNSVCPSTAQDSDADGYVELAEGQVTYGPIIIGFGNVDPDMDGTVHFNRTFDLNDPSIYQPGFSKSDVLPLDLREIVLHGMTLQAGQGATNANSIAPNEADGTAGEKAVLPVTCGDIQNASHYPHVVNNPHKH